MEILIWKVIIFGNTLPFMVLYYYSIKIAIFILIYGFIKKYMKFIS